LYEATVAQSVKRKSRWGRQLRFPISVGLRNSFLQLNILARFVTHEASYTKYKKVNVKVNITLEQTTKAQRGVDV
jgi:hypothetical protein